MNEQTLDAKRIEEEVDSNIRIHRSVATERYSMRRVNVELSGVSRKYERLWPSNQL